MNEIENKLQLVITEKSLGSLTTNAMAIRDKVREILPKFKADNYSEETIDEAKKDKAMLNTTSKALNDERIKIEKEFMKPFEEFKNTVKETTDMIKEASTNIDSLVKEVENKSKEDRKKIIESIYNDSVNELKDIVSMEMIFDDKWLNKGSFNDKGEFKLVKELEEKLSKIRSDLEAIKNLNSEHELALTNQYLKTFDLSGVIIENNRLNELKANTQKVEIAKEEIKEEQIEEMITKKVEIESYDPIKTYRLQITGTLSQQKKLAEFIKLNNMEVINLDNIEKEKK